MHLDTVNANRTGCAYEVYVLGGLSVAEALAKDQSM